MSVDYDYPPVSIRPVNEDWQIQMKGGIHDQEGGPNSMMREREDLCMMREREDN